MKKILTLFVAMIMAFTTAFAQQKNYVGESRFFDNVSIGLYGGVQTNLHNWEAPQGAITGIRVNKEITPTFGLTLDGGFGWNTLGNWIGMKHVPNGKALDNISVLLEGRTNLFNLFGGYRVRAFDMETVVGLGWLNSNTHEVGSYNDLMTKFGMNFNWNFGHDRSWTLTVQPSVNYIMGNGTHMDVRHAIGQVTAGITYRFKTSNGTHHAKKAVLYDYEEVDGLRQALLDAQVANAELQAMLLEKPTEVKEIVTETVTEEVPVLMFPKVQFLVNSAVIQPTTMANLVDIADEMKDSPTEFIINGFASVEGSEVYNQTLSNDRAEAVKAALVKLGVNPDKLKVVGHGPTNEFGDDYSLNRVVTFEEVED